MEPTQPDDLIGRMQADDLHAFEEFFNTYKRPVYTTALAITRGNTFSLQANLGPTLSTRDYPHHDRFF